MKSLAILLLCAVAMNLHAAEPSALKLTKTIPLPGVKGRFDHFALDANAKRLFVAALGNNTLEVLDVAEGKRLRTIASLHKPTGVIYLPEANRIGVANGDDGTFKLFDGGSYELASNLRGLDDADNVRRNAKSTIIYVGYGDGALAVLDAAGQKKADDIKLPGHPESFQLEAGGPRIFVNVPDAKQIAVLDRDQQTVTATWPMKEFQANFPMALDEVNHRLFIGCRDPARLVVFGTATGKRVADLAISGDTDDLFYDAKSKRLYISCGEGFVDVIEQRDADHYQMRERIPTRAGARTSFFSAELDEFYLAVPQRADQNAEVRVFQP